MTRSLRVASALVLCIVVAGAAAPACAKKARSKLRDEVTMLKARLAQLEARLDVASRRFEAVLPAVIGGGLCADPCAVDSDQDGIGDCEDFCPCDAGNADGDGDGLADCADPCPDDAENACIDPCRADADGDGVTDCEDPCPWDPNPSTDGDDDGIPDCFDPCPGDPSNVCVEPCPLDSDGDGVKDCTDPCPFGADGDFPCLGLPPGAGR